MRRGDIVLVRSPRDIDSKSARPAIVVSDDHFAGLSRVALLPLTGDPGLLDVDASLNISIDPSPENGLTNLTKKSRIMLDRLTTVDRSRITDTVGQLTNSDMRIVDTVLLVFLFPR